LDFPRVVGGIREALHLVGPALARLDLTRLVTYAARGSRASTCQRLGVLLERQGVSERLLTPLKERANETDALLSMIRDEPRVGGVNKPWRVVETDRPVGGEPIDPDAGRWSRSRTFRERLAELCEEAALSEGIQPVAVERDYYLTRLIWALAQEL